MTIRSKLMLSYGVMLTALLAVGTVAIWSTWRWQETAAELRRMHGYGVQAERLRLGMYRQINYALDFLSGDPFSGSEYERIKEQSHRRLSELKGHRLSPAEEDHIEGLEETITEIEFRVERIFALSNEGNPPDASTERPRLREISDEVASDIAVLNQYYRARVDESLVAAARAGDIAALVIAAAVVLAGVQLIVLVMLTHRWLVKPFVVVHGVTEAISGGDLEARSSIATDDEWGQLSVSINHMAKSLKTFHDQLATRERLSALGEAATYTAHNIRNPLAAIKAAVQVLQQSSEKLSSEDNATLDDILSTIDRLSLWVRRFLDYARPLDLRPEKTDINAIMRNAVAMSKEKAPGKSVNIVARLDDNLPMLYVDPILMEQSFTAIITNALQSGANDVVITSGKADGGDGDLVAVMQVSDNGTGIPPHMLDKLFTDFATSKTDGTGLGMAQVKKIVRLHGGEIHVNSAENSGTTISVRIPFDRTFVPLSTENVPE